jgi:hypothetical protein
MWVGISPAVTGGRRARRAGMERKSFRAHMVRENLPRGTYVGAGKGREEKIKGSEGENDVMNQEIAESLPRGTYRSLPRGTYAARFGSGDGRWNVSAGVPIPGRRRYRVLRAGRG